MHHTVSYVSGEPIIVMSSLIGDEDISRIRSLSRSVKLHYPFQKVIREFTLSPVSYFGDEVLTDIEGEGSSPSSYGGGNSVVFVGGFIQTLMPNFLANMLRSVSDATAADARWYPHMDHLGIRCAESLVYHSGGNFMLHRDTESVFTIVVMLSDPCSSDFTGGEFVIQSQQQQQHIQNCGDNNNTSVIHENYINSYLNDESGSRIRRNNNNNSNSNSNSSFHGSGDSDSGRTLLRVAMKRGDAIVFGSNSLHGVEPILSGERNVLVLEKMWPYVDSKRGDHRPATSLYANRFRIPTLIQR